MPLCKQGTIKVTVPSGKPHKERGQVFARAAGNAEFLKRSKYLYVDPL